MLTPRRKLIESTRMNNTPNSQYSAESPVAPQIHVSLEETQPERHHKDRNAIKVTWGSAMAFARKIHAEVQPIIDAEEKAWASVGNAVK